MSESKKHDKGKRHDTNLAPNVGLKNKSGDHICEQLGKIEMKDPNFNEEGKEED